MASQSDLAKLFSGLSSARPKTTLGKRQLLTLGVGALVLAVVIWMSSGDPVTPPAATPNTQSNVADAEQMPVVLASVERYRTLLAQASISRQSVHTQEALVRQHKAAVQADQGNIDNAKLQLSHTKVIAPISGRVGLRQIDKGNMLRASGAKGIVVITQLQPISVVFTAPEDALPQVMKLLGSERIAVNAYDRSQERNLGKGWLLAADNKIDPSTGILILTN